MQAFNVIVLDAQLFAYLIIGAFVVLLDSFYQLDFGMIVWQHLLG